MSDAKPLPPIKASQTHPGNENQHTTNNWVPGCLIGCGIVMLLFIVLIAMGGWFVATRGKAFAVDTVNSALHDVIDEIDGIPEIDRELILEQVDRVGEAVKDGDLTMKQLGETIEKISESPIIGAVALLALEANYINDSGLTDEERLLAKRTVQRIWRGIVEGKIEQDDLEPAFKIIADQNPDPEAGNDWTFKEDVSDEELREFIETLKTLADDAEIPDEEFEFSIGEEIKRIVDQVLEEN